MFKFNQLKNLELEISNNCQASCPMCPRNIHGGIPNPYLKLNDWTLEDFKTIANENVLNTIDSIMFCGSFGDPVINKNFMDMVQYVKDKNPLISIIVHTNGSLKNKEWWKKLATVMPEKHDVYFALDGVNQKTHSLYRIGTSFDKIIENAKTFIDAGGNATWNFLRFKHNEHEVEQARNLSKQLGFAKFSVKDTRRFESDKHIVLDREGKVTHFLELPNSNKNGVVNMFHIKNKETEWKQSNEISCYANDYKTVYINANKIVVPCCIKGSFLDMYFDNELFEQYNLSHEFSVNPLANKIKKEELNLIEELGGFNQLDASIRPLDEIIDSEIWQTIWKKHWDNYTATSCSLMCGKKSPFILMDEQRVEDSKND